MNRLLYSGLALPLFLVLAACENELPAEPIIRPVNATQVLYGNGDSLRTFNGTAQTDRVIDLSFRSSGVITLFEIHVGQRVKKGDLLAQLDNVEARLAYEQAVSALNSATSEKNTAELNLERIRSLFETGTSSLSDYEAAKNSYRTAEASYLSAQRSVDIQQEQIGYGEIYAPEDGRISAVYKEIDENLSAGEAVAVIDAGVNMEIRVGLPESVINLVETGMDVQIQLPALPRGTYSGQVSEVSPALETQTATYPVTLIINDPPASIRSGMAAKVTFDLRTETGLPQQLIVPTQSVGEDADGRYVFVLETTESPLALAKKRHLTIGELSSAGFVIVEGLAEGEWIATAGVHTLIDGQQVRISQ